MSSNTFTLEHMQSYFRKYVPCSQHTRQPITNFCTQRVCCKFMCPQCVESHSLTYSKHPIESIKTCIKKTSDKIERTLAQLKLQSERNKLFWAKSPQELQKQRMLKTILVLRELEQIHRSLVKEIDIYFRQKEQQILRQTSDFNSINSKVRNLEQELAKAKQELQILKLNIFRNDYCVQAIKKANKIDYEALIKHFKSKIADVKYDLDFNLKMEINPSKRQQFKRSLQNMIGLKNEKQYHRTNERSGVNYQPQRHQTEDDQARSRVNIPPLSADRLLAQTSLKIEQQNFFERDPFLHFFSVQDLYILRIKDIRENQIPRWNMIPLSLTNLAEVPYFHSSVVTEDGNIFITGGVLNSQTHQKSKSVYKYDPSSKRLISVAELRTGRSSHSTVCHNRKIYVVGGYSDNPKQCEVFIPRTNQTKILSPCIYETMSATLCVLGQQNLLKLGGVDNESNNSNFVQVYNITSNEWRSIDPVVQNIGQFELLSCSGWAKINQNEVFIFGGYNQEVDNSNQKLSYVFEYNEQNRSYNIKYVNYKNPPIAQGFWNQRSVVSNGNFYALQNVADEANRCLKDRRRLLVFNGRNWTTYETIF